MRTESDRNLEAEYFNISAIFNVQGPTPEVHNRWLEIWRTFMETDTCGLVDVEVVRQYACLGWKIAAIDGSFSQANNYLDHYLQHPNIAKADLVNWADMTCFRAVSLLHLRQEAAACLLYQPMLEHRNYYVRKGSLRNALSQTYAYCLRREPNEIASKELTELVIYIAVQCGAGNRRLDGLPISAKNSELCELLNLYYPRQDRDNARYLAEIGPW